MNRTTGYTDARAHEHNNLLIEYSAKAKAFKPRAIEATGHAPDIKLRIAETTIYIDVKVPTKQGLAIAADLFEDQDQEYKPTVYAWKRNGRWHHANHDMLRPRMIGGRRIKTGNGSNTDWYLFDVTDIEENRAA